jgi:hypothetical protein
LEKLIVKLGCRCVDVVDALPALHSVQILQQLLKVRHNVWVNSEIVVFSEAEYFSLQVKLSQLRARKLWNIIKLL